MKRNYFSRMMAVSLSVIITVSNVNLMAFAGDGEEKAAKIITNIENPGEDIEHQTLFVGASYDEIIFPDSLKVTVTYTEEKEVEKKVEPQKNPAEGEKKETDQDSETDKDQDGLEPANTDPASTDPTAPDAPSQNPPEGNSPADDTPAQNPQDGDTPAGDTPSQNSPAGDTPVQDPPADNQPEPTNAEPANTEPANTEPENRAPADPEPQEDTTGDDNSLIGRLFPALKVYAADEPGLDKSSEPDEIKDETTEVDKEKDQEEVKEQKDQEEQYETVIETVTVTEDIVLEGITWKLDKENSSFDKFRSDEAGAEFIFVPVISNEYEIKAEVPTITVSIEEPLFLRSMMLKSAPSGYDIEHADGKSFSQTVRVNFSDASLLTAGESYVVLRLVGNTSGKNVRKSDLEITSEPFTILESDHIVINGITDDGEGNTTAYVEYTFNNIPIYVNKGTGDAMAGGSGTYEVPDSFYGIQITTADGYSVDKGAIDSTSYYNMSLVKDINDAAWTTSIIAIANKMLQLVKPSFTVEWQDNRNYADLRPFSTGTSIEGKEAAIKQSIELYYKDGNDYVLVSDTSPVLVSPGSNHPEVEGGPFSWKFSYKNLPRYQSGETPYQWYIKLSDAFYDGQKAYYNINRLNGDGYLNITESGTDSVSLVFTDGVTGSIVWRVGSEETQVIPDLPTSGLFTTSENTMRLFSKEGEAAAVEITDSNLTVEWNKSADGRTWDYKILGLPNYAPDGDAIIYYTVIDSTANSGFKFTYDNGKDSTETDKCLTGQKIYGTIIGDAQFSFDKVWYDDKDDDSRDRRRLAISKGITFYLWRYPSNGTLADGAPVTNNAKQYSYTLTTDRAQQDSFTISLADFAGSSTATFPRYDELGYTYKYYATEVSKSELYKTVYWNSQQEFTGESTDKCVYNGGKVCNVRSAMIAPSVTKQWTVSAISDYVGSTCSFTLQRKEKGTWVDKGTLTLSGFSSSKKKVSGTFEANQLYDSYGKRYEYRVIETNVRSGSGVDLVFEQEDWEESADGKFSRVYTLNDYTYKAVSDYRSTVENGVESAQAIVTNKLYGTKKLTIIKNWTGAWGIGTGDDKTGTITISLKRDNDSGVSSKYATVTLNKPESSATSGTVKVVYEEDGSQQDYTYQISTDGKTWTWTTNEIIVPAYTDEGRQYIYSIVEENVETQDVTFYQEYDRYINGKEIKLYVTNRIGATSTDTRIDVRKIWKDDSDSSQRSNIKIEFGIYDSNNVFQPVRNAQEEPYVLILTPERDYNHYTFVNGDRFKANDSESREDAIKNHLSIRASLFNPRTGDYDREMENCTYSNGTVRGTISPIVDKANNFYRPGYNVTIEKNTNGTGFVITNTRIAKRDFSFTKNWEDSANALKLRKDFLRVALFRETNDVEEEIAYIDIPTYKDAEKTQLSSVSDITVNFNKGGEHYPAYDEDGNNYIYSVKEFICEGTPSSEETQCADGVEQDSQATSRTEVSLTATKETTTTGYVVTRENGNTEYALDAATNVMLMTESYTYTNMAAGERGEVPFYVVWHDSAKSSERPDIYLTLYYDGGENGELIPYTGSYTERWEHVEAGNKFIQKAIFSGLPSADPNGRVYTYYVTETFNNATSHYGAEHYLTPFRNSTDTDFNASAVEKVTIGQDHQLIVKDALAAEKDTVQVGDRYFIKEESFGLISISDVIKIEGRKLWLGIPDGIDVDKLPKAHIYLFRTSAYDDSNKAPEVAASAPKETKMATYLASSVKEISPQDGSKSPQQLNETKSMFVFGTYNSDGTVKSYAEFPKYDKMGYLYTYSVREVIYNTLTNENELPADIMLPIYSDNSTDLSNQYKLEANKNKREFIVRKQWSIKRSKFQNVEAKATFRLYRMELESDGQGYKPLHYAENDRDASEVSSSAAAANLFSLTNNKLELLDEKTIPSTVSSITWDNYPIFAPSGKLYAYYAVELTADMPGYTVSLNGLNSSNETAQGSGAAANNTLISGGTIEGGDRYIGVAFANSNISLAYTSEQNKKEETFRNTYVPTGFKSITFTKKWEAKDSQGNLIPSMLPGTGDTTPALKFDVYAIANTQSGKGNPDRIDISEADYDITVTPASDASTWNYTITLKNNDVAPIYSANGNLYTYYVKEKLNSSFVNANYKTVTAVTYAKANTAQGDVLNLPNPLKNTLKGTFEVQKIWDDFSNDYGMREGSIAFDVYYRLGENGTWTKYKNEFYLLNTGNKWKTSISGLPVCSNYDGRIGEYYQYRIWEKKISSADGDVPVAEPAADDPQTTKWKKNNTEITDADNYFTAISAGNYMVYNPSDMTSIAATPSKKLVNQLNTNDAVVSLKVTKKWEDDNNKYGLRPGSIKVTIQSSKNGGTIWSDVTTRDISSSQANSGNANIWEKTFDNLPKFYGNSTEAKYMYRAVETKIGSGGSYEIEHVHGTSDTGFTSDITNTIVQMDNSIHVEKRWNSQTPLSDVEVALFSTNYTGGTASTGTPVIISFDTNRQTLNAANSWTYTYTGLPKYNKDGAPIYYYVKEITTGSFKTQYLAGNGSWPAGSCDDNLKFIPADTQSDFYVIIVNTPLTSISGSKKWEDEGNKFKLRPDSVSLTLQRKAADSDDPWTNVAGYEAVTLNAANSWTKTIDKLPLYELSDGSQIAVKYQYRLAELSSVNGYTRNPDKEDIALTPEDGYEYGGTDMAQKSAVTNYLARRTEPVTVKKIWNTDIENQKNSVTVRLLSRNFTSGTDDGVSALSSVTGTGVSFERELNAANQWETKYENLPLKNTTGNEIVYYISETLDDSYDTEYFIYNGSSFVKVLEKDVKGSGDAAFLTQIINTPFTSASVEKKWSDNDNKFGTRPENVYVRLQRKALDEQNWSYVEGQQVLTLNAANSWKSTIDTLPLFKEYSEEGPVRYEYRFIETDLSGNPYVPLGYTLVPDSSEYVKTTDGSEAGYVNNFSAGKYSTIITNTLITKTVTVIKYWEDDSDAHKIRPYEITIYLDESGDYVRFDGNRCSNMSMEITPTKSSDSNTWTYVFAGLPKYGYGQNSSPAHPSEIVYEATEDVDKVYTGGFVIKNYYVTNYEVSGDETRITNTAMENDGCLIIGKRIELASELTSYAFPFKVKFTRPDGNTVDYVGGYYLYDASISDADLRLDAVNEDSTTDRIKLQTSNGVIRIPAGKVAVITGINTMYQYTITESPNHAAYSVEAISGADTKEVGVLDTENGGYIGIARGHVPGMESAPVRVVFTNKLFDYSNEHKYLKVENITKAETDKNGNEITGGQVKVYQSNKVVDNSSEIGKESYEYMNVETPYIEKAMSVEFEPDSANGYSYADTLTINWWQSGDDTSAAAPHSIDISGYFYTDSTGKQRPYTGKLTKDSSGNITVESEFERFESVWAPLLNMDGSPFKHLTVLEGSVVVTLASNADDMPLKTLVQVEFVPPARHSSNPSGGDSSEDNGSGNSSDNSNSQDGEKTKLVALADDDDDKQKNQADRAESYLGVRTGDDTPISMLIMLFVFFTLGFAAVCGKYLRSKPKKR